VPRQSRAGLQHQVHDAKALLNGTIWLRAHLRSPSEPPKIVEQLTHALWKPSASYRHQADDTLTRVAAHDRLSETAHQEFFTGGLLDLLAEIERRLCASFGADTARLECWQATRYQLGGRLDYHLDAGYWNGHYAGDRVRTFLLYLTTPQAGGATHFRALDLTVNAQAGRLLAWNNLFRDGTANHTMIHAGTPLSAGDKVTLVTWERQKPFRSINPREKGEIVTP
jgi:prolyl 4-hydroxylase